MVLCLSAWVYLCFFLLSLRSHTFWWFCSYDCPPTRSHSGYCSMLNQHCWLLHWIPEKTQKLKSSTKSNTTKPYHTKSFSFHNRTCVLPNLGIFAPFFWLDVDKMSGRGVPSRPVCGRWVPVHPAGTGRDSSHPLITRYSTHKQECGCIALGLPPNSLQSKSYFTP